MIRIIQVQTRRALSIAAGLTASAALAACASSGGSSSASPTPTTAATAAGTAASATVGGERSSRYYLSPTDVAKIKADNLYEALQKVRPEFLRGQAAGTTMMAEPATGDSHGGGGPPGAPPAAGSAYSGTDSPVQVYRDGVRLASLDDLRSIQLTSVRDVRFLTASEASIKLGTNNSAGAILVTTK